MTLLTDTPLFAPTIGLMAVTLNAPPEIRPEDVKVTVVVVPSEAKVGAIDVDPGRAVTVRIEAVPASRFGLVTVTTWAPVVADVERVMLAIR